MITTWPGWWWVLKQFVREMTGAREREEIRALIERTKELARIDTRWEVK